MIKVIFIGLLIDLLAFTLILPLLPGLLDHYKRHDESGWYAAAETRVRQFGATVGAPDQFIPVLFGGLIGSMFSFLQFLASPVVGGLSDYYGRRPMLLFCTAGIAVSYMTWTMASTFSMFVLARFIGGLAKGNVSLSTSAVADVSDAKTRQSGMAVIGIAFSLGFLIGPMVGAAFSVWAKDHGGLDWYTYPAGIALALSLADLLFIFVYFEETLPKEKRLPHLGKALKQSFSYINPISLFNFSTLDQMESQERSSLKTLGLSYFIYLFLYSGLEFTLTFLTHLRFNFTSMDQGKMFLYIGVLMAAIQGGYVRRIPVGKEKAMAMYGLLLIVPSFAVVGFAQSKTVLYVGITLYALSTSVVVPCLSTVVSKYGNSSQKGIIMGVYRSLGALGRGLGPVAASCLYWWAGPEVCYSVGGLGLVVPYLMLKSCKVSHDKKA